MEELKYIVEGKGTITISKNEESDFLKQYPNAQLLTPNTYSVEGKGDIDIYDDEKDDFLKQYPNAQLKKKESSELYQENTSMVSQEIPEENYTSEDTPPLGKIANEKASKGEFDTIPEKTKSDILLEKYREVTQATEEDISKAEEVADKEASGDFGFIDKLKRMYSYSSIGSITLPMYVHTDPNLKRRIEITKQLAQEQKIKQDDVDQSEVNVILRDERKQQELNSIKDKKTEEFIETLTEDEQREMKNLFTKEVGSLSAKTQSNLLKTEIIRKEVDSVLEELSNIQKNHNSEFEYPDSYYVNNLELSDKAKSLLKEYEDSLEEFNKNTDDLSSFSNELDLFKRNYNDWDNFWGKLSNSTESIGLNIAYLLNKANLSDPTRIGQSYLEQNIINQKNKVQDSNNLLRKGKSVENISSVEDFTEWALDLVAEQVPNTVLMATTGGASLPLMGASATGNKLFSLEEEEREGLADYTFMEKYGSSFMTGIAEGLSEKISMGQINKAKRVISTISEKELKRSTYQYLKKSFKDGDFYDYIKDVGSEGGSEALSQLAENVADKYILGKDVSLTDGLTDAFASGAFMSGAIYKMPSIAKTLATPFISKDVNQKLGENQSKIEALTKQIETGLTVEAEKALTEQRSELIAKNKALYHKSIMDIDNFTELELNDLLDIEDEKYDARKKIQAILDDVKIDDSVKQESISILKEEISKLDQEKEDIIKESLDQPNIEDIDNYLDEAFEEYEELIKDESEEGKIKVTEIEERINNASELKDEVLSNLVKKIPKSFIQDAKKELGKEVSNSQINERALQLAKENNKKQVEQIKALTETDLAKDLKLKELSVAIKTAKSNLDDFSKNTLGINVPVAVAKLALTAMDKALSTATKTADVISAGLNTIKKTKWYISLTEPEKAEIERKFMQKANETFREFTSIVVDNNTIAKKLAETENKLRESKKRLKSFKTRIQNKEDIVKESVKYIKQALSPNEYKSLNKKELNSILQGIRDVKTQAGLSKLIDQVTDIVDVVATRKAEAQFNKLLNSKKVGANKKALLDEYAVDVLNLLNKGDFLNKSYKELDDIEESTSDEAVISAVNIARNKQKSERARRKDMSRAYMEAAVEELDSAVKKGRSNMKVLRDVYEIEKRERLEKARTETSRKTKEERRIITLYKDIQEAEKLDDNTLNKIDEFVVRINSDMPSIELKDFLNEMYTVSSKEDANRLVNALFKEYAKRADWESREKRAVSLGRTVVNALTRVSFDIATIVSFISKNQDKNMLGGFLHETITHDIRRSANELTKIKAETIKIVNDKLKDIYGKSYSKGVHLIGDLIPSILEDSKIEIDTGEVDKQGHAIKLSRGEMIWLYNQYKNPETKKHFDAKGITPEMMERFTKDIMTSEDVEFADWLSDEFYPEMYPAINAVYKKIHFRNMPISQFYSGQLLFDRDDKTKKDLTTPEGWDKKATALFFGSGIERIHHKHPISTHTNAMDSLMHYVEESSRFIASAETYRNVTEILNDREVNDNLAKYTSKRVSKNLRDAVEFAFGFKPENTSTWAINFLVHSKILASLGFTPKLAVTQLMSTTLWLTESPKDIIKNINNVGNTKLLKEIFDNSSYIRERYKTNPAALEASYIAARSKVMNRYRSMRTLSKINDKAFKLALSFIRIGDGAGMFVLGIPYYNQAKKEGLEKFDGDEQKAIKYAIDKFESVASKTQQSYASHDRDLIQHTGVGKIFNMYANSPKQYFRNSIQALLELSRWSRGRDYKGSVSQNFRKFMLNHVVQGVLYQWVGSVMIGLLSDDDEENSKMKDIFFKGALLGSFNKFFILGDIIEGLWDAYQGKEYASNSDLAMFSSITSINKELIKLRKAEELGDEVAVVEHLKVITRHLSDVVGVPASKVKSLYEHIDELINNNSNMTDAEIVARLMNYSQYALDNMDKESRDKLKERIQDKAKTTRERRKALEDKKNKNNRERKKVIIKR